MSLFLLKKRCREKVHLVKNGLKFKNLFYELDENEMKILKLLLSRGFATSNDILSIIGCESLTYSSKCRIKNDVLEMINFKLSWILNISYDLISINHLYDDNRITIYEIDKNYFLI